MFKRPNLEMIAAGTAMFVSVAALFVAWDQSQVMRAQQHASVWPVVESDITIDSDAEGYFMAFDIHNLGVGPAMIKHAEIRINGFEILDFDTFDQIVLVEQLMLERSILSSSMSGVLGANQTRTVMKISWALTQENQQAFAALATKFTNEDAPDIDLVMCYCSVFDKCWVANETDAIIPREVESCPVSTADPIRRLIETL